MHERNDSLMSLIIYPYLNFPFRTLWSISSYVSILTPIEHITQCFFSLSMWSTTQHTKCVICFGLVHIFNERTFLFSRNLFSFFSICLPFSYENISFNVSHYMLFILSCSFHSIRLLGIRHCLFFISFHFFLTEKQKYWLYVICFVLYVYQCYG